MQIPGQSRKDLAAQVVDEVRAIQLGAGNEGECAGMTEMPASSSEGVAHSGMARNINLSLGGGSCVGHDGGGDMGSGQRHVVKETVMGKTDRLSTVVEMRMSTTTLLQARAQVHERGVPAQHGIVCRKKVEGWRVCCWLTCRILHVMSGWRTCVSPHALVCLSDTLHIQAISKRIFDSMDSPREVLVQGRGGLVEVRGGLLSQGDLGRVKALPLPPSGATITAVGGDDADKDGKAANAKAACSKQQAAGRLRSSGCDSALLPSPCSYAFLSQRPRACLDLFARMHSDCEDLLSLQ